MKYKNIIIISFVLFSSLGFTSCQTIPYELKSTTEKKIQELKQEYQQKAEEQAILISTQKDEIINSQTDQMVAAAGSLYGANLAFSQKIEPTRIDLVINNRVLEASAALGVEPTAKAIKEENERLRVELDETLTSLNQLQKNHELKLEENDKLVEATKQFEVELLRLEKEKAEQKQEFLDKLEKSQQELNALNDKIISMEKARADDAAFIQAMKLKFSLILGGLSLAALAAAIWSPLHKSKFAILSGAMGIFALGIWYVQGWHIAIAVSLTIVGIVLSILKHSKTIDKTNDALINHIQDVKESDPEKFKLEYKASLEDWTSKYTKVKGKTEKIPDKEVVEYIDQKLVENKRV